MEQTLELRQITVDDDLQARVELDLSHVDDLKRALKNEVKLPPITVFFDGSHYYLADGFHRHRAKLELGSTTIEVEVKKGTIRDAKLHAIGANSTHGLNRSSADKRRAVMMLLEDSEWCTLSNRELAKIAGVDDKTVGNIKRKLEAETNGAEIPHSTKPNTMPSRKQTLHPTAEIPRSNGALEDLLIQIKELRQVVHGLNGCTSRVQKTELLNEIRELLSDVKAVNDEG